MEKKTLILGVIGSDVHAVGNRVLDLALTDAGFRVVNLGVLVQQKEFVEAALEASADAILVSSLYGHGEIDCRGLKDALVEAGLSHVVLYVGGYLVVGDQEWESVESKFKAMGFDRVYPPNTMVEDFLPQLKADLGVL